MNGGYGCSGLLLTSHKGNVVGQTHHITRLPEDPKDEIDIPSEILALFDVHLCARLGLELASQNMKPGVDEYTEHAIGKESSLLLASCKEVRCLLP